MTDKNKTTDTPTEKLFQVVIAVETHTHKGEPCQKGDTLQVNKETKAFMTQHNIIVGAA